MIPVFTPEASCMLIDLNLDYPDQKIIGYSQQGYFYWPNFPNEPTRVPKSDYTGLVFPDIFNVRNTLTDYYQDLKKRMNYKRQVLVDWLYETGKVPIEGFISKLVDLAAFEHDEAEAILKLEFARSFNFKFSELRSGKYIVLHSLRQEHEDKKRFLSAITSEVISHSNRIDFLIKHAQTKGNFRELLLRNVLRKYIPNKYKIGTGFIEGCKRQCDILIYDAHNYAPFFCEDELVVVHPKSVRAVIEVKTTLTSGSLKEALELLDEIARFRNYPAPFFKGIFAFSTDYKSPASIAEAVREFYNRQDEVLLQPKRINTLFQVVDAISAIGSLPLQTELLDVHRKDRSVRPRMYSIKSEQQGLDISGVTFFSKLFAFLDVEGYAKRDNNTYFETLDQQLLYKLEAELADENWSPQFLFKNEHTGTPESILQRVSDVINWMTGRTTIDQLEEKYFPDSKKGFDPEEYFRADDSKL